MAQDDGPRDANATEGFVQQVGLCVGSPDRAARPVTVAKSRTVEHDHAVAFSRHIDDAARLEILDHTAVAVQKDQRLAFAALDVMKANAVNFDELAGRRVLALGFIREVTVHKGRNGQCPDSDGSGNGIGVRS